MNVWYSTLEKPWYTPPDALFGPVWTILYAMILAALILTCLHTRGAERRKALLLFAINLTANLLWTPLFFGRHLIGVALFDCLLIAGTAWLLVRHLYRPRKGIALLLIPYAMWSSFACLLNAHLWWLNR